MRLDRLTFDEASCGRNGSNAPQYNTKAGVPSSQAVPASEARLQGMHVRQPRDIIPSLSFGTS